MERMIFHAPHLLLSFRWLVPAICIFGSATNHCTVVALYRLLTLPLSPRVVMKYHRVLSSQYMSLIGFFFETWSGVQFKFYGDPFTVQPENVVYMSNHQCTVDWVIADDLCIKQSGYGGRVKYMLKDAIKYLPIYGWQLGDMGGIFLKRGATQNKEKIRKKLLWFKDNSVPMWLVIFPEGTRYDPNNEKKLRKSWTYSESNGIDKLNHVLVPRSTGFEVSVDAIKNYIDAVYDVTIIYEGIDGHTIRSPPPDLFSFFSGRCRTVHIVFRRIPINDIPLDSEGQRKWIFDAFKRKDRLIDEYISTGSISAPLQTLPLPIHYTLPPTFVYLTVLLIIMGTAKGRQWNIGLTISLSLLGLFFVTKM